MVEEMDLSWRARIAGESIELVRARAVCIIGRVPVARSKGKNDASPDVFYANRNQILTIVKNATRPAAPAGFKFKLPVITAEAVAGCAVGPAGFIHSLVAF